MVNEFPMTAGLVAQNMRTIFCGATIIDKSFSVTAAHCVTNRDANNLALLVGDHDYQSGSIIYFKFFWKFCRSPQSSKFKIIILVQR